MSRPRGDQVLISGSWVGTLCRATVYGVDQRFNARTRRTADAERRRSASVKDVAARGRGLAGHGLQRAQPARSRQRATRARVERAMADLGFVRNESARQLRAGTSRTLAYVMLDAGQPVLHRRRPWHRGRGRGRGPLAVPLQQQQRAEPRERAPRPARAAAGAGHPGHPGRRRLAAARRHRRRGTPVVIVDRTRRRPVVLLRLRRRRARRPAGGRAPARPRPPPGRVRRRPFSLGQVRDRSQGARRAWAEAGLPAEDLVAWTTGALDVAERAAGRRAAGRAAQRPPPDRRVLRQRPGWRWACSSTPSAPGSRAGGPGDRRLRRHRVRRRPPPYR